MPDDTYEEILRKASHLPADEQKKLIADLSRTAAANGDDANRTLFDALRDRNLIGSIDDAPRDLGTNPEHMAGFGKS